MSDSLRKAEQNAAERAAKLHSNLLKSRIIFLGDVIDDRTAELAIAQLLYLDEKEREKGIDMYINCPGGSVSAGLAIYDTMQQTKSRITTICLEKACCGAALLLAAGAPGRRFALPHSQILITQPFLVKVAEGSEPDPESCAEEMERITGEIVKIISKHTGQPELRVRNDIAFERYMTSEEAKRYGLIDNIIQKPNL
jgi:ATP-dependent Clp protease protease subunit